MKKVLWFISGAVMLMLFGCTTIEKKYMIDQQATSQSGMDVGEVVAQGEESCFMIDTWDTCKVNRIFLGMTQDGRYIVQDFFENGHVKMTDPYALLNKEDVKSLNFSPFNTSRDGHYVQWHSNGHKWYEGDYADGQIDGVWRVWHSNGKKAAQGKQNSLGEQGLWEYWHDNGQMSAQGSYVNGKQTGLWRQWYKNGQKKSEVSFVDGKADGLAVEWYESGVKRFEGHYNMNNPDGTWREWDMSGQILREENRD